MGPRRRLSLKQFEKRHPGLYAEVDAGRGGFYAVAYARFFRWGCGDVYAVSDLRATVEEALYDLSGRCYKLAGIDAAERQGYADANTGEIAKPLQFHHLVRRCKGRNDSVDNLAAVTADTHRAQHHLVRASRAAPLIEADGQDTPEPPAKRRKRQPGAVEANDASGKLAEDATSVPAKM